LQKHFGQANEDLQQILISAEKVEKRASRIKEVEFDGDEAPDPLVIPAAAPVRLAAGK
jgi:DNA recombination protein RmuC